LDEKALESITYIRATMERAGSFRAAPGGGAALLGLSPAAAGFLAGRASEPGAWLRVWLIEAVLAFGIGCAGIAWKARRIETPIIRGPAFRFLLTLAPPLAAGAVLTGALVRSAHYDLLPGVWLLLYGTAVTAGGASSVRVVPILGVSVMSVGVLALAAPASWGNSLLMVGLGGLQILFGIWIGWKHGG
jgi:hypothetical protein